MLTGNYERILEKISRVAALDKEEIERRIEAKRAKLSGLISKEGAAQVIAAELGINFDNEKLKINELLPGMKKANTLGKVINLFPVREFNKNGKQGKVVNMVIADDTSNIRVVLWDTNHIELVEKQKIKEGTVVEITNATMRDNELHLGSFSEFKLSSETFEDVKTERVVKEKEIFELKSMDNAKVRAFVVQVFDPRFFYVCPECRKKANSEGDGFTCVQHGKVVAEKRVLLNFVLDDGSETIRAVLFSEAVDSLGVKIDEIENNDAFSKHKDNLIGKELFFIGSARINKMFNNLELVVDSVEEIDFENLIAGLESK